jgi:hypothetical protein
VHNGSSSWLIPNTVLFFIDNLAPKQQHSIVITDLPTADGKRLSLNSFTVYAVNTSAPGGGEYVFRALFALLVTDGRGYA